jgi:hypothetical protein
VTAPANRVPAAPGSGVRPLGAPGRFARPSILERAALAPGALLLSPLVILAGVAIIAWDYALLPPDPVDHVAYWAGLLVAYLGVMALGLAGRPDARRHLLALAILGAVLWLPYFLRSPDRLLFVDELYHRDILARILETGHAVGQPVTLFPLPGTFPGLEHATVALIGLSGLSMDDAIRAITLTIHAVIPAVAYLAARGLGLGRRGAFVAALVYAANTSFPFFHSVFSYETLGILLFLATLALLALHGGTPVPAADAPRRGPFGSLRADRRRMALLLIALPVLAAIAVTHHVSSYVLAGTLVVAWLAARLARSAAATPIRDLAIASIGFSLAWLVVSFDRVGTYLGTSVLARIETIVTTLFIERSQPRPLFANADQPQLERMLAFSYPPLVLVLAALGVWVAWQHRGRSVLWLPFALIGPVAWVLTTPAVFTRAGELAYRAWPFLFLGVGVFVALGLLEVARRVGSHRPGLARPVVVAAVAVLLYGGISIGENQSGRFPGAPTTAAGGAANTDDVVAAARWLRETAGPGNLVAADAGTAVIFATEGRQRILGWASWYPFVVGDPTEVGVFVREAELEYLIVDRRITTLPPRYGSYFRAPPIPDELEPGVPVPAERLAVLDEVPTLRQVYAGPNLLIYRVDPDAPAREGA